LGTSKALNGNTVDDERLLYLMKVTNKIDYYEFRLVMKKYLDSVEENNETVIIKRNSGKGTVMISLEEYNSLMETLNLLCSKKMRTSYTNQFSR
jgi:PHD/YefM family antitoxin component YafN of YafNO toxin-antitoxin module